MSYTHIVYEASVPHTDKLNLKSSFATKIKHFNIIPYVECSPSFCEHFRIPRHDYPGKESN